MLITGIQGSNNQLQLQYKLRRRCGVNDAGRNGEHISHIDSSSSFNALTCHAHIETSRISHSNNDDTVHLARIDGREARVDVLSGPSYTPYDIEKPVVADARKYHDSSEKFIGNVIPVYHALRSQTRPVHSGDRHLWESMSRQQFPPLLHSIHARDFRRIATIDMIQSLCLYLI